MLNEPAQETGQGGGGGVSEAGGGHMNYIQVTPQEKEAIERVSHIETLHHVHYIVHYFMELEQPSGVQDSLHTEVRVQNVSVDFLFRGTEKNHD